MKKLFLTLCFILFSGCMTGCTALLGYDNEKTVLTTTDPDTGQEIVQTTHKGSDHSAYYMEAKEIVKESIDGLKDAIKELREGMNCSSFVGEAKGLCMGMFSMSVQSLSFGITDMVENTIGQLKKPLSAADVWNNAIDRNTITLLGSMGLTGWIIEAISGNLGSTFNVDTDGGAISDSMNDLESHFTGNDFGDGSSINADVMRRTLENMNNPVTTTTVP